LINDDDKRPLDGSGLFFLQSIPLLLIVIPSLKANSKWFGYEDQQDNTTQDNKQAHNNTQTRTERRYWVI
jgi:hypothetical protein